MIAAYPVWALYSRTLVAFNVLSTCDFGRLTQIIMKYRVASLCLTPIFLIASFYTMICRMQFPVFNVTWIFLWQSGNSDNKLLIILLLRKEMLGSYSEAILAVHVQKHLFNIFFNVKCLNIYIFRLIYGIMYVY